MSDPKAVGVRRWAKIKAAVVDPRAELRRALLRWSLCKTFVHQFLLIARPSSKKEKRKSGHWGDKGGRQLVRRCPTTEHVPGLAAVKHAQKMVERGGLVEKQEKAIGALAAVQAIGGEDKFGAECDVSKIVPERPLCGGGIAKGGGKPGGYGPKQ
jgi:hypothetical protein